MAGYKDVRTFEELKQGGMGTKTERADSLVLC
jgi:hypothetical protein